MTTESEKQKRLDMAYCVLGQLMVQYEIRGLELQDRIKELEKESRNLAERLGGADQEIAYLKAQRDDMDEEIDALAKALERHTGKDKEADDE